MKTVRDLLASKKFLVALVSVLAHVAGRYGFAVDQDAMITMLSPFYFYIVGQGVADHGKPAMVAAHDAARSAAP